MAWRDSAECARTARVPRPSAAATGGAAPSFPSGARAGMPECASLRRVKSGALGRGEAELLLAALAERAADGRSSCILAAALEGAGPSPSLHALRMHGL